MLFLTNYLLFIYVSIDQPIRQFTIWVRAQNVYREENFLDGDQFCVGRFAQEVRGWLGGTRTLHQDGDPRLSSHSALLYVSDEKLSLRKTQSYFIFDRIHIHVALSCTISDH